MTVDRMLDEMPAAEFAEHMALDAIRNQEREKQQRMADKGMNPKRPRRR